MVVVSFEGLRAPFIHVGNTNRGSFADSVFLSAPVKGFDCAPIRIGRIWKNCAVRSGAGPGYEPIARLSYLCQRACIVAHRQYCNRNDGMSAEEREEWNSTREFR